MAVKESGTREACWAAAQTITIVIFSSMRHNAITVSAVIALLLAGQAEAGFFAAGFPTVSSTPPRVLAADEIPSRYDLRDAGRVTPIRNQRPWNTCWAHAAIASLESNYLTNNTGTVPENLDLSEMSLVWFSRINADKARSFSMFTRSKQKLEHMGDYGTALDEGAYPNVALALLARLEGAVDEEDFPYLNSARFADCGFTITNPPSHAEAETAGLIPLRSSTPSQLNYTGKTVKPRNVLRMTDAYFGAIEAVPAGFANQRRDYAERGMVNSSALKALIMRCGAAMVGYYSGEMLTTNLNGTTHGYYISDPAKWKSNHEVTVIGWDDNYSRDNFIDKPENNGA